MVRRCELGRMKSVRLYFPVLRNKRAEWSALTDLADDAARHVVPIVEPLPVNVAKEGEAGVCESLLARLETGWARKLFLDAHLLHDASGTQLATRVMRSDAGMSGQISPVLRSDLGPNLNGVLARWAKRLGRCAIRLSQRSLIDNPERLGLCIDASGLQRESITLFVDRGIVGANDHLRRPDFDAIRGLSAFRDVVILGGAFPKNLTGFKVGEHEHPRHELLSWRKTLKWASEGMRDLKFGDYTIQHPVYEEPKATVMNISASIRYTAEEYWVIMRGEGVRNPGGAGSAQWPANAMMLSARPEFKGAAFSSGDAYVASKAGDNPKGTGNPETWLRAGINHHITLTVRQLATTSGS